MNPFLVLFVFIACFVLPPMQPLTSNAQVNNTELLTSKNNDNVLISNLVNINSWDKLINLINNRNSFRIETLSHNDEKAKQILKRILPQDKFIGSYALIATNRSSEAWIILGELSKNDCEQWLNWILTAKKQFANSARLQFLYADALTRVSKSTKALKILNSIKWNSKTNNLVDKAMVKYLTAQIFFSNDILDVNTEGVRGQGPARINFIEATQIYPLSAVYTDLGYYFLSKGHFIKKKAVKFFKSALKIESNCKLAKAALARIDNKPEEYEKILGTFTFRFDMDFHTYDSYGRPDITYHGGLSYETPTATSPFGGVYSVGKENFQVKKPLDKIISTICINSIKKNVVAKKIYPKFPWPPPTTNTYTRVPIKYLLANNNQTSFYDVIEKIEKVLDYCGYSEKSYFEVPDGIAIVTRIEQINSDGTSKINYERWKAEIAPLRSFSIKKYLKALFTANIGHYRVFVFILTPHSFSFSNQTVRRNEAVNWLSTGMNKFPVQLKQISYTKSFTCNVLIYEFEKTNYEKEALFKVNSQITGRKHLEKSNIFETFARVK